MSVLFASPMAPGFLNGGLILAGGRPSNYLSLAQQIETQLGLGAEPAQVIRAIGAEVGELEVHADLNRQYQLFQQLVGADPAQASALATEAFLGMLADDIKAKVMEIDPKTYDDFFGLSTPEAEHSQLGMRLSRSTAAGRSGTARMPMSQADILKERGVNREMTMLFGDIVGFSPLAGLMDADDLFPTLNEILEKLEEAVVSESGTVPGNWGDAIFALFGLKRRAHHELDAVRAALKMQQALDTWNASNRSKGHELKIRIGLNSGSVAYGPLGGSERKVMTALGDAVNIAARLEPLAFFEKKGETEYGIVVSQKVLERLGGHKFDFDPLGPKQLKGIDEPVPCFRILHEILHESSVASLIPDGAEQVSFTGRREELTAIRNAYKAAVAEDKLQMLVVSAEAGQGKTRLGHQFLRELGDAATVMIARGEDREERTPYEAIAAAIRAQAKLKPGESVEESKQRIRYLVESLHNGETEKHVQLLWRLLKLPFETTDEEVKYLLEHEEELWPQILNAVMGIIEGLSQLRPVVLVLEDLHWMAPGTLKFVEMIKERLAHKPVYLLGLTRPEFFQDDPELLKGANVQTITVGSIDDSDLRSMVAERIGAVAERDATLIGRLLELSGRNTYLTLEMAAAIKKGWELKEKNSKVYFLVPTAQGKKKVKLPSGALNFLQARIDMLDTAERDFMHLASIIGPEFTLTDIQGLAKEIGKAEDNRLMSETMAELSTAPEGLLEFLLRDNFIVDLKNGRYGFPHALMRETAYGQIFKRDRAKLHQSTARYLLRVRSKDQAIIGSHYERGQLKEEASSSYYRAAENIFSRDVDAAVRLYRKAFELTGVEKNKFDVLRGWDELLYSSSRFVDAVKNFNLTARLFDHVSLVDRAGAIRRRARSLIRSHRYSEAEAELKRALDILESETEDSEDATKLRIAILNEFGFSYGESGRHLESVETYRAAYNRSKDAGYDFGVPHSLWGLNYALNNLGEFSDILKQFHQSYRGMVHLRQVRRIGGVLVEWARTHLLCGDYDRAHRYLVEAEKKMQNLPPGAQPQGHLYATIGRTLHLQGKHEDAINVLTEYKDQHPNHERYLLNLAYLALALAGAGRLEEARVIAQQTLRSAQEKKSSDFEAAAYLALAQVDLASGRFDNALSELGKAVEFVRQRRVVADFDLDVLGTYARVLIELGQTDRAWDIVNEAKTILLKRASTIGHEPLALSFFTSVKVNREILRLWQILHSLQSVRPEEQAWLRPLLESLDFYPHGPVPEGLQDLVRSAAAQPGVVQKKPEHLMSSGDGLVQEAQAASVIVDRSLAHSLATLFTKKVALEKPNPGRIAPFHAEDVSIRLLLEQMQQAFAVADWKTGASKLTEKAVLRVVGRNDEFREILEGSITSQDGAVVIDLEPGASSKRAHDGELIDMGDRKRPHPRDFGRIRFTFIPQPDDKTAIVLEMGDKLYSQNPWNFLRAIVEALTERVLS